MKTTRTHGAASTLVALLLALTSAAPARALMEGTVDDDIEPYRVHVGKKLAKL